MGTPTMPVDPVRSLLRTLTPDRETTSDGDLVGRFVQSRDEDAFAELLRRHGPMVWGVCRRVLGQVQDAEDVFQAVWIVFARRASEVQPPDRVGPFLYGVAVRTATKARMMATQRRLRERGRPVPPDGPVPVDDDLAAILDEELAKLPEKLRLAVVTCDVSGKSRSQAARELGWPEGTVADRVRTGRERLAQRLRARGVTLSTAALGLVLSTSPSSGVPPVLADQALSVVVGGQAVSPSVHLLVESIMRTLSTSSWKLPVVLFVVCGLTMGLGLANKPTPADPPRPLRGTANQEPVAATPVLPAGPVWKEAPAIETPGWLPGSVAYTPDGKTLAVGGTGGHVTLFDSATRVPVWKHQDGRHFAAVAFSRGVTGKGDDGVELGVTYQDGVRLHDARTGQLRKTLEERGSAPVAVAFFRDKFHLADGEQYTLRRVALASAQGTHFQSWLGNGSPGTIHLQSKSTDSYAVPLVADPRMIVGPLAVCTGPLDPTTNKPVLWAYHGGSGGSTQRMDGHKAAVTCAAWSTDGKTIITGDADGMVLLWDGDTYKVKDRVGFDRRIVAVAVNADGSRAAAAVLANVQLEVAGQPAYLERVHVWDTKDPPKKPSALPMADDQPQYGPFVGLGSLAFSPDGKSLSAAFANLEHSKQLRMLQGRVRTWTLTANPKGEAPAKVSWTAQPTLELDGGPIAGMAIDATGTNLIVSQANVYNRSHAWTRGTETGSTIPYAYLWMYDTKTGKTLSKQPQAGVWLTSADGAVDSGSRFSVACSPTAGYRLGVKWAVTHRHGVKFGTTTLGALADPFWTQKDFDPIQIVWLQDQKDRERFAVSNGAEIQIVDCEVSGVGFRAGKVVASYRGWKADLGKPGVLAGSPDGSHLLCRFDNKADASATDRDLHWVPTDRTETTRGVKKLSGHDRRPIHGVVCANGKRIVTTDEGGTIIVWDGMTFQELSRTTLAAGTAVLAVALSPDGSTVALATTQVPTRIELFGELAYLDRIQIASSQKLDAWSTLTQMRRTVVDIRAQKKPVDGVQAQILFSPDGERLYAAMTDPAEPESVRQPGVQVWERTPARR